jgi:hypothetical protein
MVEDLGSRHAATPVTGKAQRQFRGGLVNRLRIIADVYTLVGLTQRNEKGAVIAHRYHIRFSGYCVTVEEILHGYGLSSFRLYRGDDHALTLVALL